MYKLHKVIALSLAFANQGIAQESKAEKFAYGPLYKISEPDLLAYITSKVEAAHEDGSLLDELEKTTKRAKNYLTNPTPVPGLSLAKKSSIRYFDPSIRLSQAVLDPNGDVVHPVGTLVNPLETFKLDGLLVLINANDQQQVSLVERMYEQDDNLRAILVNGSPKKFFKQTKIRPYFDQHAVITKRFGVSKIPAIISQEGLKIKLETIALKKRKAK